MKILGFIVLMLVFIFLFVFVVRMAAKKKEQEGGENGVRQADGLEGFHFDAEVRGGARSYFFGVDANAQKIVWDEKFRRTIVLDFDKIVGARVVDDSYVDIKKSTLKVVGWSLLGNAVAGDAGLLAGGLAAPSKRALYHRSVAVEVQLKGVRLPLKLYCLDRRGLPIKDNSSEVRLYNSALTEARGLVHILHLVIDEVNRQARIRQEEGQAAEAGPETSREQSQEPQSREVNP